MDSLIWVKRIGFTKFTFDFKVAYNFLLKNRSKGQVGLLLTKKALDLLDLCLTLTCHAIFVKKNYSEGRLASFAGKEGLASPSIQLTLSHHIIFIKTTGLRGGWVLRAIRLDSLVKMDFIHIEYLWLSCSIRYLLKKTLRGGWGLHLQKILDLPSSQFYSRLPCSFH